MLQHTKRHVRCYKSQLYNAFVISDVCICSLCVIPFKMILKIITTIIIDKKYDYLVNVSKSWLIVKSDVLGDEAKRVFGDEVNVTTEGQRHLGAVIGSQEFKDQYCREKILRWKGELKALSEIARSQPHAAYTVFSNGYKSKFTYFMSTIESFEDYVDPIQEAIDDLLLPTLFGQRSPFLAIQIVTLTPAQGGLGIPDLRFQAPQQFAASTSITAPHVDSITT